MQNTLPILIAQINPTVGAVGANADKMLDIIQKHQKDYAIIAFPELSLTGYPPEDLLFREELMVEVEKALQTIQTHTHSCHVILGHPHVETGLCFNSASVFANGKRIALYHKRHLPNYGIFDEARYFAHGEPSICVITIRNYRIGLCICEDIWQPGPVEALIASKINVLLCINASPFDEKKYAKREALLRQHAHLGLHIVYVNQVGGQDELLFDGLSLAMGPKGDICARAPAFTEHLLPVIIQGQTISGQIAPLLSQNALLYQALVCGLHDYVEKNHFPGVVLGLSGGIDSALTLAIAVDALGASRVHAVMMPSRYTAGISIQDAEKQAKAMHVRYTTLSIEPAFHAILDTLQPCFADYTADVTEENVQARIRGLLLMALSNKTGYMLLTTSNKSETAVGYATLYGDMAGGFAVLKDVLKTTVYDLAHYRNSIAPVIPERVLTRAPSAELAPHQTDQDSLPDYPILDAIIRAYMENELSAEKIIQQGLPEEAVLKVVRLIKRNEYKRRQAPPGVKITTRAFGRDWRYPITSA